MIFIVAALAAMGVAIWEWSNYLIRHEVCRWVTSDHYFCWRERIDPTPNNLLILLLLSLSVLLVLAWVLTNRAQSGKLL